MNFNCFMLSEVDQSQKFMYCLISFVRHSRKVKVIVIEHRLAVTLTKGMRDILEKMDMFSVLILWCYIILCFARNQRTVLYKGSRFVNCKLFLNKPEFVSVRSSSIVILRKLMFVSSVYSGVFC
jgi:hypothetical protein